MFDVIVQIVLLICMSFTLGNCIPQFVVFISNHGLLGHHGLYYPMLRSKRLNEWADYERDYVLMRILKDFLLVGMFILQHSLMARDCWKRCLLRFNISVSERLIYVTASSVALTVMIDKWVSTPDVLLWDIDTEERLLLWSFFFLLHTAAWAVLFLQIMVMDPLELIGVKQVYYNYKGKAAPASYMPKGLRLFYQHMRHAGPSCLWLMLWVHPVMTLDRFLLALLFSVYLPVAQRVTLSDYKFACSYFVKTTSTTTTTKKRMVYRD